MWNKAFIQKFGWKTTLLFKLCGCKARLLFKCLWCNARLLFKKISGGKQDFVQIFWMQSKNFVQGLGMQSKTLFKHLLCKTFVQTIVVSTCRMQRKTFVQNFWIFFKYLRCKATLFVKHFGSKVMLLCLTILGAKQRFV